MQSRRVKYEEQQPVYEDICRLCFCTNSTAPLIEVEEELVSELSMDDPGMLSQLCESCYDQLMAVLEFRKRLNFISTFWEHFYNQRDGTASDVIGRTYYDYDYYEGCVQLNCHVCGHSCKFGELQQHIVSEHGDDHLNDCKFCEALISYQSVPIIEETVITECEVASDEQLYESIVEAADAAENLPIVVGPGNNNRKSPRIGKPSDMVEELLEHEEITEEVEVEEEESLEQLDYEIEEVVEEEVEERAVDMPPPKKRKKRGPKSLDDSVVVVKITEDSPKVNLNPFSCNLCSKSYSRKDKLKRHLIRDHQCFTVPSRKIISEYVCSYCEKSYKTLTTFDRHLLEHDYNPFRCFICTEAFPSRAELKIHKHRCLNLTAVGDGLFQCVSCTDSDLFDSVDDLREHMATCNADEGSGDHKCSTCDETFARAHHLQLHKERLHGESVSCLKCKRTFESRALLKKHFDRAHNYKRSLDCTECGKKLSRPDKLIEHMRLHTGYACNLCNLVLSNSKDYKLHRKEH